MDIVDSKFIGLVSSRLQKFKRVKSDLYNFRCFYCGDSQRNKNKARGYLYQLKNQINFKCHNCGMSKSFSNVLKDLDRTLYDQYIMEKYKNGKTGKGTNTPQIKIKISKPVFKEKISDLPSISDLEENHFAKTYIEKRKIPKEFFDNLYFCENFKEWTNKQKYTFESTNYDEPRIIIPLINHGKIFGFQGRSLNKNSRVKYITIILDDKHPKIYGLDKTDFNKTVYVVEGPIDSMFLDNSIAMVGADLDNMFFVSHFNTEFVMVYDNEKRNKQIVDRMEKSLDLKFPIVIWPSDLKEKDINEMILSGLSKEKIMEIIQKNTYSGTMAKLKLSEWKKC